MAEEELREALAHAGDRRTSISQGEGSFYGPKIDLHMNDSLGRSWQIGTSSSTCRCRSASGSPTRATTTPSTRRR